MTGQTDTIDQTQSWRKPILAFKASAITLRDDIGVLLLEVLIQEAAMHKTKWIENAEFSSSSPVQQKPNGQNSGKLTDPSG